MISSTEEDRKLTFKKDDKLERKPLADRLTKAISTFYPFTKESYVLSLDARFGSGKTTFLRMWESSLKEEGYTVIYLDAWAGDFGGDPLVHIISELLKSIESDSKAGDKAKQILRGAIGATAVIANDMFCKATGINVSKTMAMVEEDLDSIDPDLTSKGEEIYKDFFYKKKVYEHLKKSLLEYIEGLDKKPLIILVDELDRVRPDYAVKFLEAIKHIFSVHGLCFVLAVDKQQLKKSIRQLYGEIDFDGYYRRFVTRDVKLLPTESIKDAGKFIRHLAKDYFDQKTNNGVVFVFNDKQKNIILEFIERLYRVFELSPRETELLLRIYCQLMAVDPKNQTTKDVELTAPLILIAIFIKDEEMYKNFGKGKISIPELLDYLDSLNFTGSSKDEDIKFLIPEAVLSCRIYKNAKDLESAIKAVVERYNSIPDLAFSLRLFASSNVKYRTKKSIFETIYNKIEDWKEFID